jgi:type IV pilus assembly protein PilN
MIRINLLQVHEVKRRLEVRRQMQVAALVVLLAIGGGVWLSYQQEQTRQMRERELQLLETEIASLKKVIAEVREFESRKALLQRKLDAIKTIKASQRFPAPYLDEISRRLPEQIWLESLKESNSIMTIKGKSLNGNPGVADFMKSIERSPLFGAPGLIESIAETLHERRVISFTVTVPMINPKQERQKEQATS